MPTRYENFDLHLTWQPPADPIEAGRVSVEYGELNNHNNPTPYFKPSTGDKLSILMTSLASQMMPRSFLTEAGQRVADLLLPNQAGSDLRQAFIDFCKDHLSRDTGVRIRLFYPAAGDSNKVVELTQLLSILWEYLYLPELGRANFPESNFLGCNSSFSIVHSFKKPDELDNAASPQVKRLLADLAYLSWLGDDETNQAQDHLMFNDFADEMGRLSSIINTTLMGSTPINFESGKPPANDAESDDVVQALLDNDLVHLVFHSEPSKIYLKDGEQLTAEELLPIFMAFREEIKAQGARMAILIGCNSGDGGRSIAAALHRADLPLVISFTASVKPEDARIFVDAFYRAFGSRPYQGLEQAVAQGRLLLLQKSDDALKWFAGFGLPRLFMNAHDSVLVPPDLLFSRRDMVTAFDNFINGIPKPFQVAHTNNDLERIIAWAENPDTSAFYLIGRKGVGKSTLIARAIRGIREREPEQAVIYHFCGWNQATLPGHPSDPLAFIRYSVTPQLNEQIPEYQQAVPTGRFPLLVGNSVQALRDFVLEPLKRLVPTLDSRPLIVIDDIDLFRAGQGYENSILKLIIDHWGDLVNVAKFLITAGVANPLAMEKLERLLGPPVFSLLPDRERIEVVKGRFEGKALERIISLAPGLGDHYRPIPLVYDLANHFADHFQFEPPTSIEVAASSQGVNVLYQQAIELAKKNKPAVQFLLDIATTAYEPLFPCDFAILFNDSEVDVSALAPFLRAPQGEDERLQLFHDSLKTYLERDIARREGQAALHDLFVQAARPQNGWAAISDWVTLSGTRWGDACSQQEQEQAKFSKRLNREMLPATVVPHYVRRYLALHAYEAFRNSAARDRHKFIRGKTFLALICDPAFRTVRLVDGGAPAAVQDMRNALRVTFALRGEQKGFSTEDAIAAADRLFAANDSAVEARLLSLEKQIRLGHKREDVFETILWPPPSTDKVTQSATY